MKERRMNDQRDLGPQIFLSFYSTGKNVGGSSGLSSKGKKGKYRDLSQVEFANVDLMVPV